MSTLAAGTVGEPERRYGYQAFVSYSHSAGGKLAPALQSGLQQFARPWNRLRAIRVFRDRTGLAVSPGLWTSIVAALDASEYFLLLASPQAAQSHWVDQEVRHWLSQPRAERLLIILAEGDIVWDQATRSLDQDRTNALPPALRRFSEEPLWLDLRWAQTSEQVSLQNPAWRDAIADLSSTLRGIPKDQLVGEDVHQHARATLFRRAAVSGLALLAVALAAAAVLAFQQRDLAREQARIALARQLAAQAELMRAQQPERIPLALLMAAEATRSHPGSIETQQTLQSVLSFFPLPVATFKHESAVTSVTLSPDVQRMASAAQNGQGALWRVSDRSRLATLGGADRTVMFSPDGKRIAGCCQRVGVWASDGVPVLDLAADDLDGMPETIAFSPDGRLLAIGIRRGEMPCFVVFDLDAKQLVFRYQMKLSGDAPALAFAPNGDLAVALRDKVEIFSGASWQPLRTWEPGSGALDKVAFSANGRYLASASPGAVTVFDMEKDTQAARLEVRGDGPGRIMHLGFSPSGRHLAAVGELNTGAIWQVGQWREIAAVRHAEMQTIFSLSFDSSAAEAVSCSTDGYCIGWSLSTGQQLHRFAHEHAYTGVDGTRRQLSNGVYGRNTSLFVTGGVDATARLWNLAPAGQLGRLQCAGDVVVRTFAPQGRHWSTEAGGRLSLAAQGCGVVQPADAKLGSPVADPGGKYAAIDLPVDVVRVWDTANGKVLAELAHTDAVDWEAVQRRLRGSGMSERSAVFEIGTMKERGTVQAIAVAPSGRYIATVRAADRTLRVWDASAAQVTYSEQLDKEAPLLEFLSDDTVLRVDAPGALAVMKLPSGSPAWSAALHSVTALAVSPDGRLVAAADDQRAQHGVHVHVWEAASGKEIFGKKVDGKVEGLAFDRAAGYLAAAVGEQPVVPSGLPLGVGLKVWHVPSGREVLSVAESGKIVAYDFSADGSRFAAVGSNGDLGVWDLPSGASRRTVAANPGPVAFSASGRWLAVGSRSIRILDTSSLRAVAQVDLTGDARHLEFRSGDRVLAVTGFEPGNARGVTQLRHWSSTDILAEACRLMPAAAAQSQWRQLFPDRPVPAPCSSR